MRAEPRPGRQRLPGLLSTSVSAVALGLALAVPVDFFPGEAKGWCLVGAAAVGAPLGVAGLVGAVRARDTAGMVAGGLGAALSLAAGLLGLLSLAWLLIRSGLPG